MRETFVLTWRALMRSHVIWILLGAVGAIHAALPALVRTDGTAEGWREMTVRSLSGGSYAVVALAALMLACGALAGERESRRLALAAVRPAGMFGCLAGRWLAYVAGALPALALNGALTVWAVRGAPDCRHRLEPVLPPAGEVAAALLEDYLKDPETPEAVRQAPKSAVLTLLANKEKDRYEVIPAGGKATWRFAAAGEGEEIDATGASVRLRFATQMDLRSALKGEVTFAGMKAAVTNHTQAVLEVKMEGAGKAGADAAVEFVNRGEGPVMIRPRRDVELLLPADGFAANAARAGVQMLAVTAFLAAFGMLLSAALSRPVAVFTAVTAVVTAALAPDVAEVFPHALDTSAADRFGMWITRGVNLAVNWVFASSPVSDLAGGICVEAGAAVRDVLAGALALPGAMLAAAAVIVRRKAL